MRHGSSEDQIDSKNSMDSFASAARTESRSPSPSTDVDTSRLSELPSPGALPGSSQSRMAARDFPQGNSLPAGVPAKMTCLSSCRKSCLMIMMGGVDSTSHGEPFTASAAGGQKTVRTQNMIAEARRICQQNRETVLRLCLSSNIPNSMTKKTVWEWLTTYDQGCEQEAGSSL